MAARKPRAAAKKAVASQGADAENAAKSSGSSEQKPLATGDVEQFPGHTFRADMGEGLPPQASQLNPDRAK